MAKEFKRLGESKMKFSVIEDYESCEWNYFLPLRTSGIFKSEDSEFL